MKNKDIYSEDGRYVQVSPDPVFSVPPIQRWVPATGRSGGFGIETCSGCSQLGTEAQSTTIVAQASAGSERPWWFWLAIGGGVGLVVGLVHRSGILSNPGQMTPSQLNQQAAAIAVQSGIPTILWGAPGIGKTAWLEALGETMNAEVFTVIGSTREPADISGMMAKDGTLVPPIWAQHIRRRSIDGEKSVLFLDEFSSMAPMVHAAMLRVVKDKIAGDCNFDPEIDDQGNPTRYRGHAVHVICAANPAGQGARAIDLPPPAANRMLHIDWVQPDVIMYGIGLVLGWPKPSLAFLPDDWKDSKKAWTAKEDIASFVRNKGESTLLSYPTEDRSQAGRSWPSPRSWQMATEALGAARACGASEEVQEALVKGCVGSAMTDALKVYLRERNYPDPELILADPNFWMPPDNRADLIFDVMQSIKQAIIANPTPERWSNAFKFMANVIRKHDNWAHYFKPHVHDLVDMTPDPKDKDFLSRGGDPRTTIPELRGLRLPKEEFKTFYPLLQGADIINVDPIKKHETKVLMKKRKP
jgi:hypothetical protein